ncbi:PiggyBac transposable element-derived protein 4 [Eumeta japonica]|uniref:PiggyBac transposable element-derived protein 4 n=1 Tax=Eumeta variegata TaxID=151549 RepID=A0A4C1TZK4_EUMVA|nr:PiggyBac transposable element-derived protein 4 [Eumeta japonica]
MDSEAGPLNRKRQRKSVVYNELNSDNEDELFFGGDSDDEFVPGFGHSDEVESSSFSDDKENQPMSYPIVDISLRPEDRRALQTSEPQTNQPSGSGSTSSWSTTGTLQNMTFDKINAFYGRPAGTRPIDYFNFFFEDDFLQIICDETNAQAEKLFLSEELKEASRITAWKELTVEELKIESDDSIYKIRRVLEYFNKKMEDCYYPAKQLSLDESIVLWKDRLLFRQYIKNKRHKYGIKLYMLTEPDGLILRFRLYAGKKNTVVGGKDHAKKVVLDLLEKNLNCGHSVYMDNFYNSYDLTQNLLEKKTYCMGTLRKNLNENLKEIVNAKLKKGENISRFRASVHVGKWKDKRDVLYIRISSPNEIMPRSKEKKKRTPINMDDLTNAIRMIKEKNSPLSVLPNILITKNNFASSFKALFEIDETGLSTVHVPPRILASLGAKQVGSMTSAERGTTVTMIAAINAETSEDSSNYSPSDTSEGASDNDSEDENLQSEHVNKLQY